MPEFIDTVFVKISPNSSFLVIENVCFGLVLTKTGSLNLGKVNLFRLETQLMGV